MKKSKKLGCYGWLWLWWYIEYKERTFRF